MPSEAGSFEVVPPIDDLTPAACFRVGEWLVEPDLCRVTRGGLSTHLRPQLMDLLVYLAQNAGRTVRQDELLASIWPCQPYLAATSLPRCITELRHALGDRAVASTVILTIHKRGYRLIAPVEPGA
jgi:eukaryotic-like serine/threonine-protein kinase